jgi:hypothetical protein
MKHALVEPIYLIPSAVCLMTYAVAYSLHSVRGRPARHWHRKREAGTLAAWNPVSCPRQRRSALECTTRDEYACSAGVRVASGTVIRATIACVSLRSVWDTFVPLYQGRLNCACAPYAHVPTQALCTLSCTDNQCALTWPRSTNSHISVFVKSWVFSGVPLVRLIICLTHSVSQNSHRACIRTRVQPVCWSRRCLAC